ncbi:GDP-mannose 4,6-dehydratase [Rhizoctonia solani]|uniref:GDP-mannose 4,6-dehydratase n=1 Tax=Rhizoctonia solani TaxID=456999 RepID=A0A8H8P5G3_9AGAM|nr:GDP-mannose 4,6-dehydratase [Rhizoctonia solani]QRW25981.1 GDP-mannose 4,6-dehydratase [Rhizoctonia solani]
MAAPIAPAAFALSRHGDPEEYRKRKVALISGITGQDGSYLTELLLEKGYEVHGVIRRSSSFNTNRLQHLYADQHERPNKFHLHYGDLSDSTNLVYVIAQVQPTEVYNLGAQSHVKVSFEMAEYTGDVDGLGTLRLLDAIRTCGLEKHIRFYQASTSELYGKVVETPQSETTPFYPRPVWCRQAVRLLDYRQLPRGLWHISRAVAEISLGKQQCLYLGNLDAQRDWGHAKDYVEGMWRILQQDTPRTLFLRRVKPTAVVGIQVKWEGAATGKVIVRVDTRYFRPAEVDLLLGTPKKAKKSSVGNAKSRLTNLSRKWFRQIWSGQEPR